MFLLNVAFSGDTVGAEYPRGVAVPFLLHVVRKYQTLIGLVLNDVDRDHLVNVASDRLFH